MKPRQIWIPKSEFDISDKKIYRALNLFIHILFYKNCDGHDGLKISFFAFKVSGKYFSQILDAQNPFTFIPCNYSSEKNF